MNFNKRRDLSRFSGSRIREPRFGSKFFLNLAPKTITFLSFYLFEFVLGAKFAPTSFFWHGILLICFQIFHRFFNHFGRLLGQCCLQILRKIEFGRHSWKTWFTGAAPTLIRVRELIELNWSEVKLSEVNWNWNWNWNWTGNRNWNETEVGGSGLLKLGDLLGASRGYPARPPIVQPCKKPSKNPLVIPKRISS